MRRGVRTDDANDKLETKTEHAEWLRSSSGLLYVIVFPFFGRYFISPPIRANNIKNYIRCGVQHPTITLFRVPNSPLAATVLLTKPQSYHIEPKINSRMILLTEMRAECRRCNISLFHYQVHESTNTRSHVRVQFAYL